MTALPVYQQSHDHQPNLGMVRGKAGADHGSAHRRNGPYYGWPVRSRAEFIDAYRLGLLCPKLCGPSHSKFSSAQDDGFPPPVVRLTQRADVCPARYRHVTLSPDAVYLPNVGNWGAFIAAPTFLQLRKHSDRQVSNCSPSHLKRLSCASVKRPQTTTTESQKIGNPAQPTRENHV